MQIRLIGEPRDVTGFALAGIDGVECRTRGDVAAALDGSARDTAAAIVLVSDEAAALAPEELERFRRRVGAPIVVRLPPAHGNPRATGRAA